MQRPQGRGSRRRSAVHLCPVRGGEIRVVGAQEPAADREAREALGLTDAGFLQERERITAGADEDKLGIELLFMAGAAVADRQRPAAVGLAGKAANFVTKKRGCAVAHAK